MLGELLEEKAKWPTSDKEKSQDLMAAVKKEQHQQCMIEEDLP